jgi:NADH-quinone oxidoreductase subunit L
MLLSTCIVAAGIFVAWWLYVSKPMEKGEEGDALEKLQPHVFSILHDKFFIDEIYEGTIVRLNATCARVSDWLDEFIWGGLVQAVSYLTLGLSWLNRLVDEFVVNLGFDKGCGSLRSSGRILSLFQNGQVQRYLRVLGLALTILALLFIWGCK